MKLIIQIPCCNEADALPVTLAALPRHVEGFEKVEWLVVDDGSTDQTAQMARQHGADHVVRHARNRGLAQAFMTGLDASLRLRADVIVNTDADNQYDARDIPALVAPILKGNADVVVGSRPIETIQHFSPLKKLLERLGSWVVRMASKTDIADAPSGFRALSRDAARQMMVFSKYTYTLETIIQAGQKAMAITSVPIRVNEELRPSRLVRSVPSYIWRSMVTIVRIFILYRPFLFFSTIGVGFFAAGFLLSLRYLYFYLTGSGAGHIQSVILSAILLGMGFQLLLIAFVTDLLAANRKLGEEIRYRQSRLEDMKRGILRDEVNDG